MKTIPTKPTKAAVRAPLAAQALRANHRALLARNALNRRFGYDTEASVRFVVEQALSLRGRVLALGTGKGRFLVALARHVASVSTVDVSAEQQQCAKLEAAYTGVADRINFVLEDARRLPWRRAASMPWLP